MGLLDDGGKWVGSPHHPLLGTAGSSLFPYVSFQWLLQLDLTFSHFLILWITVILTLVSFSISVKLSSPISFYPFFPTCTSISPLLFCVCFLAFFSHHLPISSCCSSHFPVLPSLTFEDMSLFWIWYILQWRALHGEAAFNPYLLKSFLPPTGNRVTTLSKYCQSYSTSSKFCTQLVRVVYGQSITLQTRGMCLSLPPNLDLQQPPARSPLKGQGGSCTLIWPRFTGNTRAGDLVSQLSLPKTQGCPPSKHGHTWVEDGVYLS